MFKVVSKNKDGHAVTLQIKYNLYGSSETEVTVSAENEENAYVKYAELAFNYLLIQVQTLDKALNSIKKHYFDESASPYESTQTYWRNCYQDFKDLRSKLSDQINSPVGYTSTLANTDLSFLIPRLHQLNRVRIREIINNITEVNKYILNTYKKINQL